MKPGFVAVRSSQNVTQRRHTGVKSGTNCQDTLYSFVTACKNRTRCKKTDAQKTQFHQNKIPSYASITACQIKDGAAGKTSHDRWHAKPGRILSVLRRIGITERGIKEETEVNVGRKNWEENGKKWIITSNKEKKEGRIGKLRVS